MAITYGEQLTVSEFAALEEQDRINYVDRLEVRAARELVVDLGLHKRTTFLYANNLAVLDTWLKKYLKGDEAK